ncbi:BON domain-containing protein [Solitalea sp. MAHUQ-68]|uniref:BON domain-containing protein n=1 Tax=Solitalea agri TaxID=2953739 RepID=A0A9X2F118_9SPHI|nr:BON domain-containing protein [Solitalea agri]MCO4292155.1 BON domain-containing protein [Solitalea agri]
MRSNKLKWITSSIMLLLFALFFTACGPKDSQISEEVNKQIASYGPGVSATVEKGVVTLNGELADEMSRGSLETLVKSVKGVKSVVNNTTVKVEPPPPAAVQINPDDVLKTTIEESFKQKGISGVTFSILNGEVTLTGEVTKEDLMKAVQAANEAKPKKVINQLKVIK